MRHWPDVLRHLDGLAENDICAVSVVKCRKAVGVGVDASGKPVDGGPAIMHKVKLELAASIDFGSRIRDVCLQVEADHLIMLDTYDLLLGIEKGMQQISWVNVKALSHEFHAGMLKNSGASDVTFDRLLATKMAEDLKIADGVVKPAVDYFYSHFGPIASNTTASMQSGTAEMRHLVSFFKYARIVDPNKARLLLDVEAADEQAVAAGEVGLSLIGKLATVFPVLRHRDDLSKRLESELPAYLVALQYARQASGLSAPERSAAVSAWWAAHAADLPAWAELARLVFLASPTSAAVERVFSILRKTFDARQKMALEDYVETSLMLQYNNRPGSGLPPR